MWRKRDADVASLAHFVWVGRLQLLVLDHLLPLQTEVPMLVTLDQNRQQARYNGLHGHYNPDSLHIGVPHHRFGRLQVTLTWSHES